ncbi:hypothetical protein GGR58DRAFT_324287 [Xylaria digitata]|nr:hypothetical protein GGR58DRAFT_324287 [Xylaria digitata]
MEELDAGLGKLNLNSESFEGGGPENGILDQIPFRPSSSLTTKLSYTPRYLFRVFSKASAGENTSVWIKSPDATKGRLADIFARNDAPNVAITLNEHLRWSDPKSQGDPFISWTTSLAFAIHYAIYKRKTERTELQTIYLCIVDTTKFPQGVFLRDLDLVEEFEDKVPEGRSIIIKGRENTWKYRGLGDFGTLRRKKHSDCAGFYYFGEYLSQGQMKINGRSCIVSCDKMVNHHLFTLVLDFRIELSANPPRWAQPVVELREPFYCSSSLNAKIAETAHLTAAITIALEFMDNWVLPVFANLLALSPRRPQDGRIIGVIIYGFSSDRKRLLLSQETKVVADDTIPEVQQFGELMRDIKEGAQTPQQSQQIFKWLEGMDQNDLSPLIQALSRLTDCHTATTTKTTPAHPVTPTRPPITPIRERRRPLKP